MKSAFKLSQASISLRLNPTLSNCRESMESEATKAVDGSGMQRKWADARRSFHSGLAPLLLSRVKMGVAAWIR